MKKSLFSGMVRAHARITKTGKTVMVREHTAQRKATHESMVHAASEGLKHVGNGHEVAKVVSGMAKKYALDEGQAGELSRYLAKKTTAQKSKEDATDLSKSHVKAHMRQTSSGKVVAVREHDDGRHAQNSILTARESDDLVATGKWHKETVSAGDVDEKKSLGWRETEKKTVIAGRTKTVVMLRPGGRFDFVDSEEESRAKRISGMGKTEKRLFLARERRRMRGLDD